MTTLLHKKASYQIAENLGELGVEPGDILMVHSSVKSLGEFDGGLESIIKGFLYAISPMGTLLMPTLSWTIQPEEVFDTRLTTSIVGLLPEYFRLRPGTIRSLHPTHSVCGTGAMITEFIQDHFLDRTPCGPHSPFRKITQTNGKIVMLGCSLKPNTTMHALEELVEPPYLFGPDRKYHLKYQDGVIRDVVYRTHNFYGWEQRYDRVAELNSAFSDNGFLKTGKVLQANTYIINAARLHEAVIKKLNENPLSFVDKMDIPLGTT
jgi:aminoglycoside 3-N-acetyltransferase